MGNRLSETDRRGILTTFAYDRENRLLRTIRDGVTTEIREYDQSGNVRFSTDANGNITGFEYDERNLVTAENRPLAAITRYRRDDMGDVVEERDPEGRVTQREYDLRRRMVAEVNGAGERTELAYDGNGNRTRLQKPEGNAWLFRYDGADRLVEVTDPEGGATLYGYDPADNRTSTLDGNGNPTSIEYDERNRPTAVVLADGARDETDYDPNGNPLERRDPLGQITRFEHDALNRPTLRSFAAAVAPTGDDLESITVDYDPNGNALTIVERYDGATGLRTTTRSWDSFDRLETTTDPRGEALRYAYDANGNRTRITDPDGRITSYRFDALNRTESVTVSGAGVTEYRYFRNDNLREIRYPNGSAALYEYDLANRVTRILNTQNAALVSEYRYGFDLNGNRIEQVETNGGPPETTRYTFDAADRLLEGAYPDRTTTYSYDDAGNRLTETDRDVGGTVLKDRSYGYDSRNRLFEVVDNLDPPQSVTYGFDANGNQVSRTRAGVTTSFSYDVRDQLQEVSEGASSLGRFRYDFQGLRIRKESPSGVLRYVYDDQSVLLQTDDGGATIAKYDYGPDRLLSLTHTTQPRQFYLFDGLRSVANLVQNDGAILARYRYDAFGNPRGTVGGSFNPFGFTGQERDDATGLYYFKARFYDPETGRFLSEDPADGDPDDPPSLHRYLYAKSNPTVYVDPTGRWVESVWDAASLGIGLISLVHNIREGNYGDAALDVIGVVADAAALALPIVPGGAGVAIKAARAARLAGDAVDAASVAVKVDRAVDALQVADSLAGVAQGSEAALEEFQDGNLGWGTFNAAMAVVAGRQAVANGRSLARAPQSAPSTRATPPREQPPVETKPRAQLSGENPAGGTDAASSINRQSVQAKPSAEARPRGPTSGKSPDVSSTPAVEAVQDAARRSDPAAAERLKGLPETPGIYHVEARGEYYTGSGVNVRSRLSNPKHPAADLVRDPGARVTVYPADISRAPATRSGANRALRVLEQDVMDLKSNVPKVGGSRNRARALTEPKREPYRTRYDPRLDEPKEY